MFRQKALRNAVVKLSSLKKKLYSFIAPFEQDSFDVRPDSSTHPAYLICKLFELDIKIKIFNSF